MRLILNRRHVVEQEIARLHARLAEMQTELGDLDTAERVFLRLSGAERHSTRQTDEPEPEASRTQPTRPVKMPMPIKIQRALSDAYRQGLPGLEPKEIAARINARWPNSGKPEHIGAIVWRMWKGGRLIKLDADTAIYALPANEKPVDATSSAEDASTGLLNNPEHGREAGQGGGA